MSGAVALVRLNWRAARWRRLAVVPAAACRVRAHRTAEFVIPPASRLVIGGGAQRVLAGSGPASFWLERDAKLVVNGRARLGLGAKVRLGPGARVTLGDNTYLGANSFLWATDSIDIGGGCAISWDVTMIDSSIHKVSSAEASTPVMQTSGITVANHVWIGFGATILPGVTIGEGAVVAARSVVTADVASRTLVGGTPARVLRENVEWSM